MVPEPWTRCPVDKDKYKYKYKTRSVLESCTRCSVDKDKKDKARQGEFSTRTRRTLCLLLTRVLASKDDLPYLPGNKDKSRKEGIPYLDKRVLSPEGSLPPPQGGHTSFSLQED